MWQKIKERKWIVFLVADLFLVNVIVLALWLRLPNLGGAGELVSSQPQAGRDVCGADCRAYIDQKLTNLPGLSEPSFSPGPSAKPSATPKASVVATAQPRQKIRQVQYFSILGSGQTTSNDWVGLSGTEFYFDKGNYLGLLDISFEGNLKLLNGNGSVYVRIFDVTHGIAVQGSEISASSQTSVVVSSGSLAFWAGNNLYRIQAKSLTADTAIFNSGRLKITTEN